MHSHPDGGDSAMLGKYIPGNGSCRRFQQVPGFAFHHRFGQSVKIRVADRVSEAVRRRRFLQIQFGLYVNHEGLAQPPFFHVDAVEAIELHPREYDSVSARQNRDSVQGVAVATAGPAADRVMLARVTLEG